MDITSKSSDQNPEASQSNPSEGGGAQSWQDAADAMMDAHSIASRIGGLIRYDPTRSDRIDLLVNALAQAQSVIRAVDKNRSVTVTPRDSNKRSYSFKFATLDHIIEAIRKPLTDHGLWFTQILKKGDDGVYLLDTRLMHCTGQWIACQTPLIVEGQGNQQFGSALTFMRRYALTTLLGIAAEEDDDANIADGNNIDTVSDKETRKPNPPKPDVITTGGAADSPKGLQTAVASGKERSKPFMVLVPVLADGTGSNWLEWGKAFMAAVRANSDSAPVVGDWEAKNKAALDQLMKEQPKTYANLQAALQTVILKLKKDLSKDKPNE